MFHHQSKHVASLRAEHHSQTKFFRPTRYGVRDHSVYANSRDRQSDAREKCQEKREKSRPRLCPRKHIFHQPHIRKRQRWIDLVHLLCDLLDEGQTQAKARRHRDLIQFVKDRPGHDRRYAIDAQKIANELGWKPAEAFENGLRKTVRWYLENGDWVESVRTGAYLRWIEQNYTERLT